MSELIKAGLAVRHALDGRASMFEVVRNPEKRPSNDGGENQGSWEGRIEIHGSKGAGVKLCSCHKQEEQKNLNKTDGPSVCLETLAGSKDCSAQHAIRPVQGAVGQGLQPRPSHAFLRGASSTGEIDWDGWAKWLNKITGSSMEEVWNWIMERLEVIAKELIVSNEEADRLLDGCLKRSRKAGIPPAAAIEEMLKRSSYRCRRKAPG